MPKPEPKFAETNQEFGSGAKRGDQTGRPRPDLIPGVCMLRVGLHYGRGAEHYGERNFEKGMPSTRMLASLQRHLEEFKKGDESEDHLAAIVFNAMGLIFNEEMAGTGHFPNEAEVLDLPWYTDASS